MKELLQLLESAKANSMGTGDGSIFDPLVKLKLAEVKIKNGLYQSKITANGQKVYNKLNYNSKPKSTGLFDQAGNEIFVSDKLRCWCQDSQEKEGGFWCVHIVVFEKGCYILKDPKFEIDWDDPEYLWKELIYGNLKDNSAWVKII